MKIPHWRIVLTISLLALAGYAVLSVWIFARSDDKALIGDVLGTWKSFAVGAVAFWIGSSSGGKVAPPNPTQEEPNP